MSRRTEFARMFQLLARTRTKYTECIKITRVDGQVFRFTAHDKDLVIREPDEQYQTYKAANSFVLTSLETSQGLVVSNMDIDGLIDDDDISEEDLRLGFYENANVELFLAYWADRSIKILPMRASWVGEIQMEGPKFKVDLRGIAQRLANTFIQATSLECRWTFADGGADGSSVYLKGSGCGCGLTEADWTDSLTITSLINVYDTFAMSGIDVAKHDYYYQWGKCRFTSGANNGFVMEILYHYQKQVKLFLPVPYPIEVGDTVELVAGCDKAYSTCGTKFNNKRRFGGEPFLAGNDFITRYPDVKDGTEEDSE